MKIIKGYWKSNGKHPIGKEENRKLYSEPPEGDYVAVYQDGYVARVDIDDYNHKTGLIEEPIKGKPRSEAILQYLNSRGYRYSAIKTEHGIHIIMLFPKGFKIPANRLNWYCAMGIKIEVHVTKVFEPIVVNGIQRSFIKGGFDADIDELAPSLYPLQKSKENPFVMQFEAGDRNNHFSEYAFHLANKGLNAEAVKEVIESINDFVCEEPLEASEIDTILRPETMQKLQEIESINNNGVVSPEVFKTFLKKIGLNLKYNELLNVVEYDNIPDSDGYRDITDIQNVMPIQLQYDFRRFTKKQNITKHQVIDLIVLEADIHAYNPVKEYLSSVPWDKKDRFPEIYNVLGVSDELEQALIKKWFFQCAGMAFNTIDRPFQAEGVLVLQGAEGIGKTRFFQKMAVNPLWFSSLDKELTTKNKDILIQMLSVWIAEIGEIDRTFKANKSDIKSFITSRDDRIRKPYRSEPITKARTTSFCGTTNKNVFLNDDSGSRRWWIVHVTKRINLNGFLEGDNLQQFWSQCFAEYSKNPNCFRLTDAEMETLKARNKEAMEMVPSEEELRNRFDFEAPVEKWNWSMASALVYIPAYCVANYTDSQIRQALYRIMQDDSRIKVKRGNQGYKFFIPPAKECTDRYGNKRQ